MGVGGEYYERKIQGRLRRFQGVLALAGPCIGKKTSSSVREDFVIELLYVESMDKLSM